MFKIFKKKHIHEHIDRVVFGDEYPVIVGMQCACGSRYLQPFKPVTEIPIKEWGPAYLWRSGKDKPEG